MSGLAVIWGSNNKRKSKGGFDMGRAAQRRKANRRNYLAKLSYHNPKRFEFEWEARLQSWLFEIRRSARNWKDGKENQKSIFEILDEAMEILKECEESICKRLTPETYGLLCHECCDRVSRVVDPRLYRLSKMDQLIYKSKAKRHERK